MIYKLQKLFLAFTGRLTISSEQSESWNGQAIAATMS